ncbi:MAG: LysR substrate-binding domain-containing protein [Pseudomonadota bacterium]|nr:LysR substrate-binding domain-containing protein [Pseudomonadota bacterium]
MDIRQLRYFSEVVNAKSFTKAATRVHIAQPALGLQVRKLEEELGVELLHRHSRGVETTEEGKVLLRHANAILKQVEQALHEVRDLSGEPRGEIVLGITPTASALIATPLIRECRACFPDISLTLFEGLSEEIMKRLDDNSLDMGFTYNPSAVAGIATEPLMSEDLYLVGSIGKDDPGRTVSFSSVCERSLILPSTGFGLRDWLEERAEDKNQTINVALEIDSVAIIRDLVEDGLGWSVLPFPAVQQAVKSKRLFASQIVRPRVPRTLHIGYASSHTETKASRAIRGIIDKIISSNIASSQGQLRAP